MRNTYETVDHWRQNSFLILSGKTDNDFVIELAQLYQLGHANDSALHFIAFTVCCVFQMLLLQKPHAKANLRLI